MPTIFWIVVYCLHVDLCYVSKDDKGIEPMRYATEQMCEAAVHGGREVHSNSSCHKVTAVSCFNGGSRCTFTPADNAATDKLRHMAPLPPH
jgi:hypothetical protein